MPEQPSPPSSDSGNDSSRFAPPEARGGARRRQPESQKSIPKPPNAPAQRPKVYTPPEERFPPVSIPRDVEVPPTVRQAGEIQPKASKLKQKPSNQRLESAANAVTVVLIILMVLVIGYFVLIWRNPYSPLNLFPPPTPLPVYVTATFLPPTETATPEPTETPIFTPIPQNVLNPPNTPTALAFSPQLPTAEVSITPAFFIPIFPSITPPATPAQEELAYRLTDEGVQYTQSARGCDWLGIRGVVLDADNRGVNGVRVQIVNQESGERDVIYSGALAQLGDGGFELQTGDEPNQQVVQVQLIAPDDTPLSAVINVVTRDRCEANMAVVNFRQVS